MKFNKIILLFIASILALFMLFGCENACVDNNNDGKCDDCGEAMPGATPEEPDEPDEPKEPEENDDGVMLIEDGKANFNFVIQRKAPSNVVKAVDNLIKSLKKLNVDVTKVYDEEGSISDCEVIIDVPTTRGDAYAYDMHDLGEKGYLIKLIDGKILIVGGSYSALVDAISVFTEDFLGVDKKTKELTDVKVTEKQNIEIIQDDYRVTSVKLNGEDMNGYTIAADSENEYALTSAQNIQSLFYSKTGLWLPIVDLEDADKSIVIRINPNTYEGNGYSLKVEENQIVIETEFPDKLDDVTSAFFSVNVSIASGEVNFTAKDHNETKNLRNIYYSEFGAAGDGITDDFLEIKDCHDYANKWGHNVFADAGKTYYIGKKNSGETIPVRTDTDWKGCRFIIDDSNIEPNSPTSKAPIFTLMPDNPTKDLEAKFIGKSLSVTDTNIGYAPGETVLIKIFNKNVKRYIRYGVNENTGSDQSEILLVHADGTIDPLTPLVWDYETITGATQFPANERPISVGNAIVDNIANQAPNLYTSYARNINIRRSNTTVHDIDHSVLEEGPTRAPYQGTIFIDATYNVTVTDIKAQLHARRYDQNTGAILGTYEFGANAAVCPKWINCYQKNFFNENGTVNSQGLFGTNYCRRVYLEGCFLNSFDAHGGLSDATIKNSTFEHMNFIGNGDIVLENVNIYVVGNVGGAINLREDYGSTWRGDVYVDGLLMKYFEKNTNLSIIKAYYTDWNFGYTCYFPQNITLKDIRSAYVAPTKAAIDRLESEERVIEENAVPIHICNRLEKYTVDDISKLVSEGGSSKENAYQGTKTLTISDCELVPEWVLPNTPQFTDMKVYINGSEEPEWKTKYGSKLNP